MEEKIKALVELWESMSAYALHLGNPRFADNKYVEGYVDGMVETIVDLGGILVDMNVLDKETYIDALESLGLDNNDDDDDEE